MEGAMPYTEEALQEIEREQPLLASGAHPVPLRRPNGPPMSNLNLRMPGEELVRLSHEARRLGLNPTQLARRLIIEGLAGLETKEELVARVEKLEKDVGRLKVPS